MSLDLPPGVAAADPRTLRAWGPLVRPLLAALAAAALLWWHVRAPRPEAAGARASLAELLSRDHGLHLVPASLRPAGTAGAEILRPRPTDQEVYFTAGAPGGEPDLFQACVRVASDGRVVDLGKPYNLTETPYASERLLAGSGDWTLYGIRVHGQLQSVLLVDDRRDERVLGESLGAVARAQFSLTNLQRTGRLAGVGLRLYTFSAAPEALAADFPWEDGKVHLRLAVTLPDATGASMRAEVRIDPKTGAVVSGDGVVRYEPRAWAASPFSHWLVDTVRDFEFIGPRPIVLLEKWVFSTVDRLQRLGFSLGLVTGDDLGQELGGAVPAVSALEADGPTDWPPPLVPPLLEPAVAGEGRWIPVVPEWLPRLPGAPPAIYKTALRTDADSPHSTIVLGALDLRQLDFDMVAGLQEPRGWTGVKGSGRIRRDPELLRRVVAACNGGFQTAHGAFGMMVDRRVIMPAMPRAATVAIRDDGRVAMGTWNNSMDVPDGLRSFRQNLPPLVADGVWNPTRKRRWGGTVSDLDKVNTTRSAIAFSPPHTLLYAWGESTSAEAIGRVLNAAGAEYGLHLDMNPFHAGFELLRLDPGDLDEQGVLRGYESQPLSSKMRFDADRFANRNAKDFFYLSLRRRFHERLPEPPPGFAPWEPYLATACPDPFLPRAALSRGADDGDLLVALDLPTLDGSLQAGTDEPRPLESLAGKSAPEPIMLRNPVAVIDLGTASHEAPAGLTVGGRIYWPPRPDLPAIVVDEEGRPSLVRTRAEASLHPDVRQCPPRLLGGERVVLPDKPGKVLRRHILGLDRSGRAFYVTRRAGGAHALLQALEALDVRDAVALPPTEEDVSRVLLVGRADDGIRADDPLRRRTVPLAGLPTATTRLYLGAADAAGRATRLRLGDVELSPQEARRQRRLIEEISMMRESLREVANQKYRRYIEKVRLRREHQTGIKEWDGPDAIEIPDNDE